MKHLPLAALLTFLAAPVLAEGQLVPCQLTEEEVEAGTRCVAHAWALRTICNGVGVDLGYCTDLGEEYTYAVATTTQIWYQSRCIELFGRTCLWSEHYNQCGTECWEYMAELPNMTDDGYRIGYACCKITPPFLPAPPGPPAKIFSDGFESGDLSAWPATS